MSSNAPIATFLSRAGLVAILLAHALLPGTVLAGELPPLKPPFKIALIRAERGVPPQTKFECKKPPAAFASVEVESKYAPGTQSNIIDPTRAATYDRMVLGLRKFTGPILALANGYVKSTPADARLARCASTWMSTWADNHAAELPADRRGEAVRAQLLTIVSFAYIQIKDERTLPAAQRKATEAWIRRLATRVSSDFSTSLTLASRQNNHLYWAGWSVMAAGIALNDRAFFDWGVASAKYGIDSITPDGFLPLELQRKQRSLGYHFYAAEALVMLAEGALANGVDLYKRNDGAIGKLVATSVKGWADPSAFVAKTGIKQDRGFVKYGGKVAWALIYSRRFPAIDTQVWRTKYKAFSSPAAGGDVDLLYFPKGFLLSALVKK